MKNIYKVYSLLILLTLSFVMMVTVEAADPDSYFTHDGVEYDRIFKDSNDVWHGVIKVNEVYTPDDKLNASAPWVTYFDLSRDTKDLYNVKLRFYTDERWFFKIFGEKIVNEVIVDTTYKSSNLYSEEAIDSFGEYGAAVWKNADTDKIGPIGKRKTWDYIILTPYNKRVDEVISFEFDFVLTDYAVDELNEDIQVQRLDEIQNIIDDPLLGYEEKLLKIEELNEEYSNYVMEYDEVVHFEATETNIEEINKMLNPTLEGMDLMYVQLQSVVKLVIVAAIAVVLFVFGVKFLSPIVAAAGRFFASIFGLLAVVAFFEYMGWFGIDIYARLWVDVTRFASAVTSTFTGFYESLMSLVEGVKLW